MQQQKHHLDTQSAQKNGRTGSFWFRVISCGIILIAIIVLTILFMLSSAKPVIYNVFYAGFTGLLAILAFIAIFTLIFPKPATSHTEETSSNNGKQPSPMHAISQISDSIFYYNIPAPPTPDEYFGRMYERTKLCSRIHNKGSTAIAGTRRIGKTWLMEYLRLIAPTHPDLGPSYRIGIFSATNPECHTVAGFIKKACQALNIPNHYDDHPESPLKQLSRAVADLKMQHIIPVLCIDEFEGFAGKQGFDKSFIEGLRAIIQDDGLVLVTASKKPLHEIIEGMIGETSPLFNIVQQLMLKPFMQQEATTFITAKASQANFTEAERNFFRESAAIYQTSGQVEWPPLRLQLAGQMLLDDKLSAHNEQRLFHVQDALYQAEFKRRLLEQYQMVVKQP